MSSSTATAASAKKIANYTQSISTGVTNLLTEIGRISTPAPAPTSDGAILLQLQALTGQIVGLVHRVDEVQQLVKGLEKRLDGLAPSPAPSPCWELKRPNYIPASEGYNELARLHNSRAAKGSSMLLPLHNRNGCPVLGFPTTVSQLFDLDARVKQHLCTAFALQNVGHELEEFVGVAPDLFTMVAGYSLPPEMLALDRIKRVAKREEACRVAGPPTAATRAAAEVHNRKARAHNANASEALVPIHDARNIPVEGFPRTFDELANPAYRADVLYFLREYGQGANTDGCVEKWFKLAGVDVERALDHLEIESYTWLD